MDFYKLGQLAALKLLGCSEKTSGSRVATPYQQTYQRQAESWHNHELPTNEEISAHWDEHDKRMREQTTPQAAEDTQLAT